MILRSGSSEVQCGSLRTTDLLFSDCVLIFKEKKGGEKKAHPGQTLEGSSLLLLLSSSRSSFCCCPNCSVFRSLLGTLSLSFLFLEMCVLFVFFSLTQTLCRYSSQEDVPSLAPSFRGPVGPGVAETPPTFKDPKRE